LHKVEKIFAELVSIKNSQKVGGNFIMGKMVTLSRIL